MDTPCPTWAAQWLDELRRLETRLGNLPATGEYRSEALAPLLDSKLTAENHSEKLFDEIVRHLRGAGWADEAIAAAVNARINYPGGPAYCSAAEVAEVEGSAPPPAN